MTGALTIVAIALSYSALYAQHVGFEVASIKAIQSAGVVPREFRIEPAVLRTTATILRLVAEAYSLPEVLVTGGPSWSSSQLYVMASLFLTNKPAKISHSPVWLWQAV